MKSGKPWYVYYRKASEELCSRKKGGRHAYFVLFYKQLLSPGWEIYCLSLNGYRTHLTVGRHTILCVYLDYAAGLGMNCGA